MDLPAERDLPELFKQSLREHLVTTAHLTNRSTSRRTQLHTAAGHRFGGRRVTLGVAVAAALLFSGGAAVAATSAVHHQTNGVVVVDSQRLSVVYHGHLISQSQLVELNKHHEAMFYAGDVKSAEQGDAHAFDTMAELDAYSQQLIRQMKTASHPAKN